MKIASVYLKGDVYYFLSSSRTTEGVWIGSEPLTTKSKIECPESELGEAAIAALAASRDPVEHPANFSHLVAHFAELVGAKSWAAFEKGALRLEIELQADLISFIPTRNIGRRRGFEPLHEKTANVLLSAARGDVGNALILAMGRCQCA